MSSVREADLVQPRSHRTRQRILDCALQVLVADGYAGATTVRVQQVSGLSRGALLYHFNSKDELLVAAVSHLAVARIDAMALEQSWPVDPGRRIEDAVGEMWRVYRSDFFWAACELWLAARHNEPLHAALAPAERRVQRQVRAAIARMFGPELTVHPDYPRVRDLLNTSMRGVGMTYAFDRRNPDRDSHLPLWRRFARTSLLDLPLPASPTTP